MTDTLNDYERTQIELDHAVERAQKGLILAEGRRESALVIQRRRAVLALAQHEVTVFMEDPDEYLRRER